MFDLTIIDYVYIGIVLASTVWATIRGGVYETVATLSWVLAAVAARFVSPWLDGVLQGWGAGSLWALVLSYFIVFFVILVGVGFFNQRLRDRIQESMMNITDHTLGVIFGIVRGIALMGLVYWGVLVWYSDSPQVESAPADCAGFAPQLPEFVMGARTLPLMQLTAVKIHDWFIPGTSMLLMCDMVRDNADTLDKLLNQTIEPQPTPETPDVGYQASERDALENQLLQIDSMGETGISD